jgi:hypothetical protein
LMVSRESYLPEVAEAVGADVLARPREYAGREWRSCWFDMRGQELIASRSSPRRTWCG